MREWESVKRAYELLDVLSNLEQRITERAEVEAPLPQVTDSCSISVDNVPFLSGSATKPVPPPTPLGRGSVVFERGRIEVRHEEDGAVRVFTKLTPRLLLGLAAVELMNEGVDVTQCLSGAERRMLRILVDEAKEVVRRWWSEQGEVV